MCNIHTNLEKHEILLQDLKEATKLSFIDIENLYKGFLNVTKQRMRNQADGSVNFQEFSLIMKYKFIIYLNVIKNIIFFYVYI